MPDPDMVWRELVEAQRSAPLRATGSLPRHEPRVAVLACADARVPPSVLFDQPAGSMFVVRIAGNGATPAAVASLDYAVGELGVELVVVLGHVGCGAVQAAADGVCEGHLAPVVSSLCQLARDNETKDAGQLVHLNVASVIAELGSGPGPTGLASRAGQLMIRGSVYDLRHNHLLDVRPLVATYSQTQPERI